MPKIRLADFRSNRNRDESSRFGVREVSSYIRSGDVITINFPMHLVVEIGRETPYPQLDYFDKSRELAKASTIDTPYASVYYGPLLFSLPIPDLDPNHEIANAKFNYALDINTKNLADQVIAIKEPMPEEWNWSLDAPVKIKVPV